jgi:hypothetical protein
MLHTNASIAHPVRKSSFAISPKLPKHKTVNVRPVPQRLALIVTNKQCDAGITTGQ